jgi:hypothetical protein
VTVSLFKYKLTAMYTNIYVCGMDKKAGTCGKSRQWVGGDSLSYGKKSHFCYQADVILAQMYCTSDHLSHTTGNIILWHTLCVTTKITEHGTEWANIITGINNCEYSMFWYIVKAYLKVPFQPLPKEIKKHKNQSYKESGWYSDRIPQKYNMGLQCYHYTNLLNNLGNFRNISGKCWDSMK